MNQEKRQDLDKVFSEIDLSYCDGTWEEAEECYRKYYEYSFQSGVTVEDVYDYLYDYLIDAIAASRTRNN